MDGLIKKKMVAVPESAFGVCVWELPDDSKYGGGFLCDGPNNYLCMEGIMNDPRVERKMREAVKYWTGETGGKPHWFSGARMVTNSERDDQAERLASGLIPDWEEAARIAQREGRNGS